MYAEIALGALIGLVCYEAILIASCILSPPSIEEDWAIWKETK